MLLQLNFLVNAEIKINTHTASLLLALRDAAFVIKNLLIRTPFIKEVQVLDQQ